MREKWPPIDRGTYVQTTRPNMRLRREWTEEAWNGRWWGIYGTVIAHHDSHGLSYEVRHPDGSVGHYDPSELFVVQDRPDRYTRVYV